LKAVYAAGNRARGQHQRFWQHRPYVE
jgi:hypothetical protein